MVNPIAPCLNCCCARTFTSPTRESDETATTAARPLGRITPQVGWKAKSHENLPKKTLPVQFSQDILKPVIWLMLQKLHQLRSMWWKSNPNVYIQLFVKQKTSKRWWSFKTSKRWGFQPETINSTSPAIMCQATHWKRFCHRKPIRFLAKAIISGLGGKHASLSLEFAFFFSQGTVKDQQRPKNKLT